MFRFTFYSTSLIIALHILLPNIMSAQWSNVSGSPKQSRGITKKHRDTFAELSPLLILSIKEIDLSFALPNIRMSAHETAKDTLKTQFDIVEKTKENDVFDNETCIDLAFDSVSIIKMEEKYIEIEYSIINKGTAPAPIFGTKRSLTDNVAVHFYFSGTPRLNRGSILAEGIYLTEGLRTTKGMLAPNAVYKNRIKLSLEKKNRFYGVIILQLDAFDILRRECDETNNNFSIVPKWY